MNGWERLATVAAALCAAPAFLLGYGEHDERYVHFEPSASALAATSDQAKIDAVYDEAERKRPELRDCRRDTILLKGVGSDFGTTITCDTTSNTAIMGGLRYAIWPIIFFWALAATVRWVYQGFRPPK